MTLVWRSSSDGRDFLRARVWQNADELFRGLDEDPGRPSGARLVPPCPALGRRNVRRRMTENDFIRQRGKPQERGVSTPVGSR